MALHPSAAAIETEIDEACIAHPLLNRQYSDAVFHVLSALDLEGANDEARLTIPERSIRLSHSVSAMKHAMRWLALHSPSMDAPFRGLLPETLQFASDFLQNAEAFLMISAAYSWAHRDMINLAASGRRLTMTFNSPNDDRYEAYDMLIKPAVSSGRSKSAPEFDRLNTEIEKCFSLNMVMGGVPTARNVLSAAYDICSQLSDSYYQVPLDWDFGSFVVADFRKVNDALRSLVTGWLFTTDLANFFDRSYMRDLPFKIRRSELIGAVKDITGLSKSIVNHIVSLLTYSRNVEPSSDPALQPLMAVAGNELVLSSRLVLGGSPERNMISLINTRPAERASYDRLKNEKEALMRERVDASKPSYCRSWQGKLPGRKDLPNIDYALFDDRTGMLVIAELKWFVAPDEPRELADRSEEIKKGVEQCKKLTIAITQDGSLLKHLESKM